METVASHGVQIRMNAEYFNCRGYGLSMRPLLVRSIDWFIIKYAALKLPKEIGLRANLEEAGRLLESPHFIHDPEGRRIELHFEEDGAFEFESPVRYGPSENLSVPGRFFQSGDWDSCPTVLMIHGYNSEAAYFGVMLMWARQLEERGFNVVMFELPFHGARRPVQPYPIRNYFCGDLLHVSRVFQQTLYELQGIAGWLRRQGCPSVGFWGNSLGALIAGNLVSIPGLMDSLVMLTPVVRLGAALDELSFTRT
ncbi:hypothetical protein N9B94_04420, partial [Verrucomicrobia bacterium]|nr:hypothetical protein [Verrucomicrobiota bacterium]